MITDGDRIKQILRNFLSNAIKFVDSGQITVLLQAVGPSILRRCTPVRRAESRLRAEPGGYVALGVTDTGIGIPADRQKIIFEAFRQADGTTSRKYGGTGLGLNIVTKLADLLEGAVGMWSQEGEGSTFFVVVPLRSAVNEAAVSSDEVSLVTSKHISKRSPQGARAACGQRADRSWASPFCSSMMTCATRTRSRLRWSRMVLRW